MQLRRSGWSKVMVVIGPSFLNRKFSGALALIGWLDIFVKERLFVGGLLPDAPLMHQGNLPFDHLFAVFLMLHRRAVEVKIFGVNRLLVQYLVKLGAQILHPVIPLRIAPMKAQ